MNVVASEAVSDFQTFAEAVKVSAEPVVVTAASQSIGAFLAASVRLSSTV